MNITKIILSLLSLIILVSCWQHDDDELTTSEDYTVGTFFLKGKFNSSPLFHTPFHNDEIYTTANPNASNFTNVDTFDLDLYFELPFPSIYYINFKSINMNNFNHKTFYFNHSMLINQEPMNAYKLQKENSFIQVDTVIYPDKTYAHPRVIGSLFLIGEKGGQVDTLFIEEFELPFGLK